MRTIRPTELAEYDPERAVAVGVMESDHSNVRMIRLGPGVSLPPHTHGESDLFLYVVEGAGELDTTDGPVPFSAGDLAHYRGDEELRVTNNSTDGLTLLAFLAPVFPPATGDETT
ncbi:cupin domain-containing protein [Rhabdothermincola salaria]|uniref:cupin domain-containing protein n=1 Tax=Rhabdothermincola salaria TaxID=2903142 RepID=UPI001E4F850A|nr:cupin domain-containing protein [Rhabdothermincola salaria]MCD9624242.1 cupin domain-containing protein [Rhabdothermincola salaria]